MANGSIVHTHEEDMARRMTTGLTIQDTGRTYLNREDIKTILVYMRKAGVGKYVSIKELAQDSSLSGSLSELKLMTQIGLFEQAETLELQYKLTPFGLQVAEKPENYYDDIGQKLYDVRSRVRQSKMTRSWHARRRR